MQKNSHFFSTKSESIFSTQSQSLEAVIPESEWEDVSKNDALRIENKIIEAFLKKISKYC